MYYNKSQINIKSIYIRFISVFLIFLFGFSTNVFADANEFGVCGLWDSQTAAKNAFPVTPAVGVGGPCSTWNVVSFTPDIVPPVVGLDTGLPAETYIGVVASPQGGNFMGVASDLASKEFVEVVVNNLIVGETYNVSFVYANTGRRASERDDVSVQMTIPDGNNTIINTPVVPYDPDTWYFYSRNFVATATSATMQVGANALNDTLESAAGVDAIIISIVVPATPVPMSEWMLVMLAILLLVVSRRKGLYTRNFKNHI